jgi:phosphotransferase system enzyme I (PtsP)
LKHVGDEEENPALGWRALRLALDQEGLMKAQARALLEAAAGRNLNVMFPMVSEPWEFDAAKAVFEAQLAYLSARKKQLPSRIRYGAMLEVPALAETLDLLLPRIDFLSIGTNDLTQFLFAADRADPRLAERYDWLSPAIMRFIRRVVAACGEHKVDLTVCGEMGGRSLEAMALIGIGIRRLSITPAAVGAVKAMVRSLDGAAIAAKMDELLSAPPASLRDELLRWAADQSIEIA